ncbi:hypothetical protein FEE96_16670 [Parasedimentitalea maritima]|uniref:DUF1795 domain-containing protein n=1 Tax=Parasedimentitalea maritima TaxID=2578117 RepID=A0ABY2UUA3_9RHOB|nr:hypothetical protein [Zongyanglinia marina]TLP60487.1 hypothetical protein FEE96_16670 [Zongyanglinia marina]
MLRRLRKTLAVGAMFTTLSLLPSLTLAEMPVTYMDGDRALFRFSVPDFWTARAGGERNLTPPGADESRLINRVIGLKPVADTGVWLGFISPHGVSNYESALEYLRGVGPFLVQDAEVEERKRITVDGLPAARIAGSGRRDGRAVGFTAVVVVLPSNRVAISVVVMEAGVNPDLVSDVNAVFASFRAIR